MLASTLADALTKAIQVKRGLPVTSAHSPKTYGPVIHRPRRPDPQTRPRKNDEQDAILSEKIRRKAPSNDSL